MAVALNDIKDTALTLDNTLFRQTTVAPSDLFSVDNLHSVTVCSVRNGIGRKDFKQDCQSARG